MKVICFHNPDEVNGYLSNWMLSEFEVDGIKFTSAEQYMMYSKAKLFFNNSIAEKILSTSDVKKIKQLGRKVTPFKPEVWDQHKEDIMFKGLSAKFSQNPDLLAQLLATEDDILAEAAKNDHIWGIGLTMRDTKMQQDPTQWKGQNLLGKTLMKVREALR